MFRLCVRFFRHLCSPVVVALVLAGCAVPDYRHAQQQLAVGNTLAAYKELEELADHGVVPAMLMMGDQLSKADPVTAEQFYLRAIAQGDVKSRGRLAKLYAQWAVDAKQEQANPAFASVADASLEQAQNSLRFARDALALGDDSVLSVLVKLDSVFPELNLAEETQVLIHRYKKSGSTNAQYAQVLWWESGNQVLENAAGIEKICLKLDYLEVSCYRSLVNLYRLQQDDAKVNSVVERVTTNYKAGRLAVTTVVSFANWFTKNDSRPSNAKAAISLLEMVAPVYAEANYDIARILYVNPTLPEAKKIMELLTQQEDFGNWRANELLGEMYFNGKQAPIDPGRVQALLSPIQDKSLVANYYLGLIERDGLLGAANPDQALAHLLTAARFGHDKADVAIAELFWQAKGIARNPVYAYSFASIAAVRGSQRAQRLTLEIEPSLAGDQKEQAIGLSQQEISAREVLRQKHLVCCDLNVRLGEKQ